MTQIRGGWRPATTVRTLIILGFIGTMALVSVAELNGQGPAKSQSGKPKSAATSDTDVVADLDQAISMVEKDEFKAFLEKYAPVEVLRRFRQQDLLERAAAVMATQAQTKKQLIALLKALRKETPAFDKSRGLATFQFDPFAHGVQEVTGELHLPITDDVKLVGLGSDLKKVVAEATRLLADGEVQSFVERMFPASELARLKEPGAMADLLQQIKGVGDQPTPAQRVRLGPAAAQQPQTPTNLLQGMLEDFKRLENLTAELTDKGQIALFRIDEKDQKPLRAIKFQKVGSDWRLFDDTSRVSAELTRQSKLQPRAGITTVQMERVGGNWRFVELPALQQEGK